MIAAGSRPPAHRVQHPRPHQLHIAPETFARLSEIRNIVVGSLGLDGSGLLIFAAFAATADDSCRATTH